MTRGTFYLITNDKFYSSVEFNGDMYPEGHGKTAKEMLEKVENVDEFKLMLQKFDKQEGFNYGGTVSYEHNLNVLKKYKDFNYKYFDLQNEFFWFSDWLFIKNTSDKEYVFTYTPSDEEPDRKDKVTLKPGEVLISCFGHEVSDEDLAVLEGRTPLDLAWRDYREEVGEYIKQGVESGQTADGKITWSINYKLK